MAANQKTNPTSYPAAFDPSNTTFVTADPSNFREVVQKLTGDPQTQKNKVSSPSTTTTRHHLVAGKSISGEMGPRRPVFKLHERRLQNSAKKLEIGVGSPRPTRNFQGYGGIGGGEMGVVPSPVSPLEWMARGSPRSPMLSENHEGFYLQASPLSTPRGVSEPPQLLPLFPLHSPRDY